MPRRCEAMSWKVVCTVAGIAAAVFIGYKLVVGCSERAWTLPHGGAEVQPVPPAVVPRRRWRARLPAALRLAFWSGVVAAILLLSGLAVLPGPTAGATVDTSTFTATE